MLLVPIPFDKKQLVIFVVRCSQERERESNTTSHAEIVTRAHYLDQNGVHIFLLTMYTILIEDYKIRFWQSV